MIGELVTKGLRDQKYHKKIKLNVCITHLIFFLHSFPTILARNFALHRQTKDLQEFSTHSTNCIEDFRKKLLIAFIPKEIQVIIMRKQKLTIVLFWRKSRAVLLKKVFYLKGLNLFSRMLGWTCLTSPTSRILKRKRKM